MLETKAGQSVRDRQLLVRTSNFLTIYLQIDVWISQNSDQDRQLFQLSPEHCTHSLPVKDTHTNMYTLIIPLNSYVGLSAWIFNILKLKQNGHYFADSIFKSIFFNGNAWISIPSTLVQVMAWCWTGDKTLLEPNEGPVQWHICVTQPQWLSGEPDYFGRKKISSGGDLSHYSSASLY